MALPGAGVPTWDPEGLLLRVFPLMLRVVAVLPLLVLLLVAVVLLLLLLLLVLLLLVTQLLRGSLTLLGSKTKALGTASRKGLI